MTHRLLFALALALPAPALADVSLTSQALVEKTVNDASGTRTVFEAPKLVVPGDKLVFALGYKNDSGAPANGFVITNPLPKEVAYRGAESAGETVSVDGGKTWGRLAELKVRQADGTLRAAQEDDVTHVRWALASAIPAGGAGQVRFRGVVR